jgi:signal transduction histidine kinase/ligand-binding sensor domain-containing protein
MNSGYGVVAFRGNRNIPIAAKGALGGSILALLFACPLLAVNPSLSMGQYLHTTWTQEEGSALPPIQALAQTADGYLWLGTGKGLMHFDGMRFVEWSPISGPALPNSNIRRLCPASGGGLWVGTAPGVCRLEHGRVVRYPAVDKLPCGLILAMLEDRIGRLWILDACPSAHTLALLSRDGTMQTFGTRDGLPDQLLTALFQDREGNLWIGTSSALCRWSPGSVATCSKGPALDVSSIAQDSKGQLVLTDPGKKQGFYFSNGQATPIGPPIPDSTFQRGAMICDRDGNIWVGSTEGLLRLQKNKVDRLTRTEGLSSNVVSSLVEDHEGDIWVGTARGVDRFRDPKIQLYSTLTGLSSDLVSAVDGAGDGAIWIGTSGGLNRLAGERVTGYSSADGLPSPVVLSLYEDTPGNLSVGTGKGLARQSGNRFIEVVTPSGQHLDRVFNIAGNHSGTVWLSDSRQGLFSLRGGTAYPVTVPGTGNGEIYRLLVARNGDVWLGHYGGGVTVLSNGSVRQYGVPDGLGSGPIRALYEDGEGAVWAGTADGLSRFCDARWTTWTTAQGLPEGGVQGIVEDHAGGLWLMVSAGVLRLSLDNLTGPVKSLAYVLYGRTEGLRLVDGGSMANPLLARSRDGRVWVSTEDGAAAIDPARVKSNRVLAPVVIEQVIADGKTFDTASPGEVVFRGHDLQINYTGISLMAPERVRFRYRLYGLNPDWTEAGTRRNVAYVNLPPRLYRFKVIASNNDGVWNEAGAELVLRVNPYFYQTTWFALVCLISALLATWSIHRMRVRQVVARVQLIAAERVRFSRELHDSLLQGFSGVVYLLEAAARQFEAAPAASKQRLERALDQADQSLREARQMIVSMRIPALDNSTLPEALRETIGPMLSGMPVDYQFDFKGFERRAPYEVEANLFLIAREAVTNSLNHAAATRIRLELCYTPTELRLTIEDDGVGFDPEMAMAKAGHWGFRGMRERAHKIGATFDLNSAPGRGTRISVVILCKK